MFHFNANFSFKFVCDLIKTTTLLLLWISVHSAHSETQIGLSLEEQFYQNTGGSNLWTWTQFDFRGSYNLSTTTRLKVQSQIEMYNEIIQWPGVFELALHYKPWKSHFGIGKTNFSYLDKELALGVVDPQLAHDPLNRLQLGILGWHQNIKLNSSWNLNASLELLSLPNFKQRVSFDTATPQALGPWGGSYSNYLVYSGRLIPLSYKLSDINIFENLIKPGLILNFKKSNTFSVGYSFKTKNEASLSLDNEVLGSTQGGEVRSNIQPEFTYQHILKVSQVFKNRSNEITLEALATYSGLNERNLGLKNKFSKYLSPDDRLYLWGEFKTSNFKLKHFDAKWKASYLFTQPTFKSKSTSVVSTSSVLFKDLLQVGMEVAIRNTSLKFDIGYSFKDESYLSQLKVNYSLNSKLGFYVSGNIIGAVSENATEDFFSNYLGHDRFALGARYDF